MLDVQLGPQQHVYASGVSSEYIPIEWRMKDSSAIIVAGGGVSGTVYLISQQIEPD